jgi:hypothetical protein
MNAALLAALLAVAVVVLACAVGRLLRRSAARHAEAGYWRDQHGAERAGGAVRADSYDPVPDGPWPAATSPWHHDPDELGEAERW